MVKSLNNLTDFTAGEISPRMDARVDSPTYRKALRTCLNLMVEKQGPLTRAPRHAHDGTDEARWIVLLRPRDAVRFQPQTYLFTSNGETSTCASTSAVRTGLQSALSRCRSWVTATNYLAGSFVQSPDNDFLYYTEAGINGGTTDPSLDPTHWTKQTIYEVPTPYSANVAPLWVISTTYPPNSYVTDPVNGLIYYTASGVVTSDEAPSIIIGQTPWALSNYSAAVAGTDVFQIVQCQINDVVYLAHAHGAYPIYSLTRYGDTDWVLKEVNFLAPALLDQNTTNTTIAANATTGNGVTLTATAPNWTTGRYYEIANSVLESSSIYECLVAHVAGTFATDLAAG